MRGCYVTFKHLKIKHKLSLLIALIVMITFAFTVIVQQYAFSLYDSQLYQKSAQVLNLSSSAIETELKRLENVTYTIVADTQIQSMLQGIRTSDSDYDRLVLRQHVLDRLFSYAGSEPSILSLSIIDSRGMEHAAGNLMPIDSMKRARLILAAGAAKGDEVWSFPDRSDPALILSREMRSFRDSNFDLDYLGTIVVRINIQSIVRKFAEERGDFMMMAGNTMIYPTEPRLATASITEAMDAGRSGYFIHEIDGRSNFISYSRSSEIGWTYINITLYDQIFERIVFIKKLVVAVFIVIFIGVILLGIRFSLSLTRPIEQLMSRMKLAEKGNFAEANLLASEKNPLAMDEIGLLHRTFRIMVERINTLITENYSNQLLLKETEFKALQAHINPHFLYNTLQSINWMARLNGQAQISQMVESLGFLLRHSIQLKERIIPLREELAIVESYVTIQAIRFEERLVFRMDVPPQYMSREIPKLTLQPLLENSIQYALEPGIATCAITIRARESAEGFVIVVEDDGPGMAVDTLDQLKTGKLRTNGKGIGLLNIDERIKLAYGEAYGLRIDSKLGHGTRIMITLPGESASRADVNAAPETA